MNKNKANRGPGRPFYDESKGMAFPKHTPFSFREFCLAQGMEFTFNTRTVKGKRVPAGTYIKGTGRCAPLTLRNYMLNRGCPVIEVEGLFAEPLGKNGLGRKAYMLTLRDGFIPEKTVAVAKVSVPVAEKSETPAPAPAKRKYTRKAKTAAPAPAKAKRKYTRKTPTATVDVGTGLSPQTQTLEDIKAALAAPTPALPPETPVATVPVVSIPAPVATPAPATTEAIAVAVEAVAVAS